MIFHICSCDAWHAALAAGIYEGSADDTRDGFIHFSGPDQVVESAARHRAGQPGLVLIGIEASRLGEALKWESSRGGASFPHLYGGFSPDLAVRVDDLALDADGLHIFPEDLEP
ncbi:MAG: DUF952 domain-containing protein [Alphaproteobacteria bacterium]